MARTPAKAKAPKAAKPRKTTPRKDDKKAEGPKKADAPKRVGKSLSPAAAQEAAQTLESLSAGAISLATQAYVDAAFGAATSGGLVVAPVKTANYTAASLDFVPVDISGGSVAVTLPTAPSDKTRIGVKVIKVSGTPGSTSCSINRGGSDVFNIAGGSTSLTLSALFQGVLLEYKSSGGIWYVTTADTPLGVALGAAKLGTDGTVGGPSGSTLASSVINAVSRVVDARDRGVVADGVLLLDAAMTSGSGVLTTGTAFSSADVGKLVLVVGAGTRVANGTGTTSGSSTTVTISGGVWRRGMLVTGAGVPAGTTVVSVNAAGTSMVLSAAVNLTSIALSRSGALTTTVASVASGVPTLTANAGNTTSIGTATTLAQSGSLAPGADTIQVASSAGIEVGNVVTIDSGGGLERAIVIDVPDSTHLDLNSPTTLSHATGVAVTVTGTVAIYGTNDTAAVNATITAAAVVGRGSVAELPTGIVCVDGTEIQMASRVHLRGRSRWSTWLAQCAVTSQTQPGVVTVPFGVKDFAVSDMEISSIHWSGGQFISPAEAGLMCQGNTVGRLERLRVHHTRNSGIAIESHGGQNRRVTAIDCEAWGTGEDAFEVSGAAPGDVDRVRLIDCIGHHAALDGLECDGTAAGWMLNTEVRGFTAYKNGSTGVYVHGVGGTQTRNVFEVNSYDNVVADVQFSNCTGLRLGVVSPSGTTGVQLSACSDVLGTVESSNHTGRGVLFDTACSDVDLTVHAAGNCTTASVGTYAVEVLNSGGACSDINLRGTINGNTQGGFQATGLTRGKLDLFCKGNGDRGYSLQGCSRLGGILKALNNKTYGLDIGSTSTNNAFLVDLDDDGTGPQTQTTGWRVADAPSTGNSILELRNGCSTPFSDAGSTTRGTVAQIANAAQALVPTLVTGSGAVSIPTGANHARVIAVGGGGGGGGGGSAAAAQLNAGGSGGGAGQYVDEFVSLSGVSGLTATIGAGGTSGSLGAAGGNAGGNGGTGTSTTLAGTGLTTITALGGGSGLGSGASSTSAVAPGDMGGGHGSTAFTLPGGGGASGSGGAPGVGPSGGGGGGGGAATATNGGGGGTAATSTAGGGAGSSGGSGTSAGATGASPAANTGAGANGGGGGAAGTGAGGAGGVGGSGYIVIYWQS